MEAETGALMPAVAHGETRPSEGATGQTPAGKKPKSEPAAIINLIAKVEEVCEEPEVDWQSVASTSKQWRERQHAARQVHLEKLRGHEVAEVLPVPPGVRPLTCRWVDKDEPGMAAKSRLVCRGYEQSKDEDEKVYSATPMPASLRTLLCVAQLRGLAVAIGDCSDAFLQAPLEGESVLG